MKRPHHLSARFVPCLGVFRSHGNRAKFLAATAIGTLTLVVIVRFAVMRWRVDSALGVYRGYSAAEYDGWECESRYIESRDKTRLAIDIFRPTKGGRPAGARLPVVWTHERYQRATLDGRGRRGFVRNNPWLKSMLAHGYIVAAVDARGTGTSFGRSDGPFSPDEARDAYDVTEWLASQPWSNGQIGMFGDSYMGTAQYLAAAQAPPHLKAIVPRMALFDIYSTAYENGILNRDFITKWTEMVRHLDLNGTCAPVDGDRAGEFYSQALQDHRSNRYADMIVNRNPFRNSKDPTTGESFYLERGGASLLERINRAKIPVYVWSGWFDFWCGDALTWYANWDAPKRILIGPWPHSGGWPDRGGAKGYATEHLRFFDFWLKGIDNGIMREPSIHYFTVGARDGDGWHTTSHWPLVNERRRKYFFCSGPSTRTGSANDGLLGTSPDRRSNPDGIDEYHVDYRCSTGKNTRLANACGATFEQRNMADFDATGLTYTSEALADDLEVTGHPTVSFWVSADSGDANFFVFLEELQPAGRSEIVSLGKLKASQRNLHPAPYKDFSLPYHRCYAEDAAPLPKYPVNLVLRLSPTSKIFNKGHRIRLTITCADRDNALTPEQQPPPVVRIHRGRSHPSHVELPIIPAS